MYDVFGKAPSLINIHILLFELLNASWNLFNFQHYRSEDCDCIL